MVPLAQHTGGASWSSKQTNTTKDLYAIWGTPAGPVWAAGAGGVILRRCSP